MEKLLKFFETYKKYYKKGEQYTNGHLKFKDTITKEQKMQLIKKKRHTIKKFKKMLFKTCFLRKKIVQYYCKKKTKERKRSK